MDARHRDNEKHHRLARTVNNAHDTCRHARPRPSALIDGEVPMGRGSRDAAPAERTQFCQARNTSLATMAPSHHHMPCRRVASTTPISISA